MGKHFGRTIIQDVLRMQGEGLTSREIGNFFGLGVKQIRKLLERYRKNERRIESGILPQPGRRSRKIFETAEERLLYENKQLRMENELLRSFHHAIGRR